jgi:Leucine-rich repeat (LRR) protein
MERVVRAQIKGGDALQVEDLFLDKWKGNEISDQDCTLLETFQNLLSLSMFCCGLKAVPVFPRLPRLETLELSDNKLTGGLESLAHLSSLLKLSLAGNRISGLSDIAVLAPAETGGLNSIVSLDFFDCPVTKADHYREAVFAMFPTLEILDGANRAGEECTLTEAEDEESEEDEDLEGFIDDSDEGENQKRPRDNDTEESLPSKRRNLES